MVPVLTPSDGDDSVAKSKMGRGGSVVEDAFTAVTGDGIVLVAGLLKKKYQMGTLRSLDYKRVFVYYY